MFTDQLKLSDEGEDESADAMYEPDESVLQSKLTSPNMTTYLDVEKIEFERNRSGIWGWRSDKTEDVNGYECKVYTANNLQLITKTRVEHLDENDKVAIQNAKNSQFANMPSFLTSIFQGSEHHVKVN